VKLLVRSALVAAFGAAVALQPAIANADSFTHIDSVGDLMQAPVGSTDFQPDPSRLEGDTASIRVSHLARTVRVKVRYRQLSRVGGAAHVFVFRTDKGIRQLTVLAGPGNWRGSLTFVNGSNKKVRCNISGGIDYVANTVLTVIPRSCLGNPRWVRVGALAVTVDTNKVAHYDDARSSTISDATPIFGPKVRR
jgi:hypothetical protein